MPPQPPPARPGAVTLAALLLWLCAGLQALLCLAGGTVYEGFPGNVWICGGFVTMPLFAAAAVAVRAGYPGAHLVTAALPLASVWCAGWAVRTSPGPALAWLILGVSVAVQAAAVALVLRRSSLAYFRRPPVTPPAATYGPRRRSSGVDGDRG